MRYAYTIRTEQGVFTRFRKVKREEDASSLESFKKAWPQSVMESKGKLQDVMIYPADHKPTYRHWKRHAYRLQQIEYGKYNFKKWTNH